MLYKQLYEYNKPEAIICCHHCAAPHLLPVTPAQQLLACCLSSPPISITVSLGPPLGAPPALLSLSCTYTTHCTVENLNQSTMGPT